MSLPSTFSPHSDGGGTGSERVHVRFCLARAFAKVVLRASRICKAPLSPASLIASPVAQAPLSLHLWRAGASLCRGLTHSAAVASLPWASSHACPALRATRLQLLASRLPRAAPSSPLRLAYRLAVAPGVAPEPPRRSLRSLVRLDKARRHAPLARPLAFAPLPK